MPTLRNALFCKDCLVFLGYVISQNGVKVDEEKVKAIKKWPIPIILPKFEVFMVWHPSINILWKI